MKAYLLIPALFGVLVGCRGNKSVEPPVHIIQNMDFQDSLKPQEKSSFFQDGRASRALPEHVVARGHLKEDTELHLGRDAQGRLIDGLPTSIKLDEELLNRGQARYDIFCTPCHAANGDGQGIVVQRGLAVPAPSYYDPRLQAMPLGYIYDVIAHGKGTMKPYANQIPVEDRWAIAAWVRTLQYSHRATASQVPAEERQRIEGGTQ